MLVADDQLSLAIGKEGQNVRLAARLTGWKIDIKDAAIYKEELNRPPEADPDSKAIAAASVAVESHLDWPKSDETQPATVSQLSKSRF